MAVDTRDKRSSTLQSGLSFLWTLPLPDGSLDRADRQHSYRWYVGIAPPATAAQETTSGRTFIWKAQDRTWIWPPQDRTLVWNQQDRSFEWEAQNRTYVWPLEVSDVTAKYPSIKDDGDITNWTQDFTLEMAALSDTIASATWTLATGLTNVSDSKTNNTASVKISGGVIGQKYDTSVTIVTTTSGETFDRTVEITIGEVSA